MSKNHAVSPAGTMILSRESGQLSVAGGSSRTLLGTVFMVSIALDAAGCRSSTVGQI